ncbi:hypothetical protein HHL28_14105 [Aerophototrophica crusticola]|uniref:histidine kinase n=1 Tax=Aerophototrophica crusticola TaxID=1709002 RepID=A0A858RAA9_9PROT|nr:hypothetical protein HHL28_14105 [Rhodospirillaceae bacterium B3]
MAATGQVGFALPAAVGSALPALASVWLLRRLSGGGPLLDDLGGLAKFFLVAVLAATTLGAGVGVAALAANGMLGEAGPLSVWLVWWLGDAMGVLVVAPPLLLLSGLRGGAGVGASWYRVAEALLLATGVALTLALLSTEALPPWLREAARPLMFLMVLWSALRFGQAGAAVTVLSIAAALVVVTAAGQGPFARGSFQASFAMLHAALFALSTTGLALGTVVAGQRRAAAAERLAREQAERALARLRATQDGLVRAEKMASLGRLVAGITHEVATPIGSALAAATRLGEETGHMATALATGTLRRDQTKDYLDATAQAARILQANMERAARLVESFKHVAVDRARQDRRRVELRGHVEEVVISLRPQIRKTPHLVLVEGAFRLEVDIFPDAVAQLVSNLVGNALRHAFPDGRSGTITVTVDSRPDGWVELRVSDDGQGIPPALRDRVFEPFFTTQRDDGGSGLGLYMAYTQVAGRLGGTLALERTGPDGTTFLACFPPESPDRPANETATADREPQPA